MEFSGPLFLGTPLCSGYILLYLPPLVIIQIKYVIPINDIPKNYLYLYYLYSRDIFCLILQFSMPNETVENITTVTIKRNVILSVL